MREHLIDNLVLLAISLLAIAPQRSLAGRLPEVNALLQQGQVNAALKQVRGSIADTPTDPALVTLLGDIRFRRAELAAAEDAYRLAIGFAPSFARAYRGMGKIRQLQFEKQEALRYFATAYRLDPDDPEIVLSYAEATDNREIRRRLLRRFLAVGAGTQTPEKLGEASARLQLEEKIGDRQLVALQSEYRAYRLHLDPFHPTGPTSNGLLLTVRIGQSRPLRLLFDTGGSGIIVNAKAVRGVEFETLTQSSVVGLGSGIGKPADVAMAAAVAIGGLKLQNVLVQIVHPSVTAGADGVIGGDVFRDFLVTIDARGQTLDLTPFDADRPGESLQGPPTRTMQYLPVYSISHFLLVQARVNGAKPGYFLLDTGSAHSVIANDLVTGPARDLALQGAHGPLDGAFRIRPVSVRMANTEWLDPSPVSADLRRISQRHGIEIAGTIGYSLLSQTILTINYRDGIVRLARR